MKTNIKLWSLSAFVGMSLLLTACGPAEEKKVEDTTPVTPAGFATVVDKNVDGEIHLLWKRGKDKNTTGFRIYRDSNADGKFSRKVYEGTEVSFVDKDVIVDRLYETTYYYKLVAFNKDNKESKPSEVISAKSKNFSPPAVPKGLKARGNNLETPQIKVSWKSNNETDLEGYYVFRSESDEPIQAFNVANSVSGLVKATDRETMSWSDKEIKVGKRYYYTVVAADKGELLNQNPPSLRVNALALKSVTVLSPKDGEKSSDLKFSWEKVESAVGYVVVVQSRQFGGKVLWRSKFLSETSVTIKDTKAFEVGSKYYWFVFAYSVNPEDSSSEDGNSVSEVNSFDYNP